jgi:hypothetical protein
MRISFLQDNIGYYAEFDESSVYFYTGFSWKLLPKSAVVTACCPKLICSAEAVDVDEAIVLSKFVLELFSSKMAVI